MVDNIEDSNFKNNTFDTITGNGILHHTNLNLALAEIKRIVKSGGKFIFFEPNLLNPEIFLERKIPILRRISHSSPDETAFIRWDLEKQIKENGFINVKVYPFDFLYPALPSFLLPILKIIDKILINLPLVKEFSGSLIVTGQKP